MSKVIRPCPKCNHNIRIPSDRVIKFSCPNCFSKLHALDGNISHRLIDRIFAENEGWISRPEMLVSLKYSDDWQPYYEVKMGELELVVYQTGERGSEYIHLIYIFPKTKLSQLDQKDLLHYNYLLRGALSFGADESGYLSLQNGFPLAKHITVSLAREQLLLAINKLYNNIINFYKSNPEDGFNWELANNIAGVIGKVVRGSLKGLDWGSFGD